MRSTLSVVAACFFSLNCRSPDLGKSSEEESSGGKVSDSSNNSTQLPWAENPQLQINEFMPSNKSVVEDEGGGSGDWIELYNLSEQAIDLEGYFLSDKLDNPTKAELGSGLVIPAQGTILLWADSDVEQGPRHLPFNLAKSGEAIILTSPMGEILDSIDYVDATTDSSFARVPDGVGAFSFCNYPTPDELNSSKCGTKE